jgi:hypothetical protein
MGELFVRQASRSQELSRSVLQGRIG